MNARVADAELIRGDRDAALDGLRALAALMVMFYHCAVQFWFPPLVVPGFCGVHLFFVLSGYLIARPFLARLITGQPLPSWRRYAVRRFVRIYPAYFVALLVFIAMRFAGHLRSPSAGDLLRHVLLVFNWGPRAEFFTINIVVWTLVIEAQFYVILPIALALAKRLGQGRGHLGAWLVVVLFVTIGLLSRGLEYRATVGGEVRFRLPFSFLDLFAMGILAAYLELTHGAFLRQRWPLRATLLLSGFVLFFATNHWFVAAGGIDWLTAPTLTLVSLYPLGICAAFALILLAVRTRVSYPIAILTARPLVFIGQISYSIYLYHVGVGYLLLTRLPHRAGHWLGAHPLAYALAQFGPVLIFSYLAYRAIELPSLRWIEGLSRARGKHGAPP
jgi:peptidoglycan/LPS O-acetylase OafA/YrhL